MRSYYPSEGCSSARGSRRGEYVLGPHQRAVAPGGGKGGVQTGAKKKHDAILPHLLSEPVTSRVKSTPILQSLTCLEELDVLNGAEEILMFLTRMLGIDT